MIGLFIKRDVTVAGSYSVVAKWVLYISACFKQDARVGC